MPALHSGTMEPTFYRGDILFLTNYDDPIRVGEIVLFKVKRRDIFVVHRVIKVHEKSDGQVVLISLCAAVLIVRSIKRYGRLTF